MLGFRKNGDKPEQRASHTVCGKRREGRTLAAFTTAGCCHACRAGLRGAGGVGAMGHRDAEVVPKVSPASRAEGPAAPLGRAGLQRRLSLQLPYWSLSLDVSVT